jgi:hypothetical protein
MVKIDSGTSTKNAFFWLFLFNFAPSDRILKRHFGNLFSVRFVVCIAIPCQLHWDRCERELMMSVQDLCPLVPYS